MLGKQRALTRTEIERIDGAAWRIANIHHPFVTSHGVECMCGNKPGTYRGFTEHVIEMYQREFDNV